MIFWRNYHFNHSNYHLGIHFYWKVSTIVKIEVLFLPKKNKIVNKYYNKISTHFLLLSISKSNMGIYPSYITSPLHKCAPAQQTRTDTHTNTRITRTFAFICFRPASSSSVSTLGALADCVNLIMSSGWNRDEEIIIILYAIIIRLISGAYSAREKRGRSCRRSKTIRGTTGIDVAPRAFTENNHREFADTYCGRARKMKNERRFGAVTERVATRRIINWSYSSFRVSHYARETKNESSDFMRLRAVKGQKRSASNAKRSSITELVRRRWNDDR